MTNAVLCGDEFIPTGKYALTSNNCHMTKRNTAQGCIFLKNRVKAGIHTWKFKVTKIASMNAVTFGIWKMNQIADYRYCLYKTAVAGKSYSWTATELEDPYCSVANQI